MDSSQNDEPEDDGVISLIDFGISKKVLLPSEQKRLDEIKAIVGGPAQYQKLNTFGSIEDRDEDDEE